MTDDLPALKAVRRAAIGDAELSASNVPETPPATWSGATNYALNQQATILSAPHNTTATVYQSLQAGNLNKDPATQPLWWKKIGTTYAAYNGATTYFEGDRVIDAAAHLVYEAATGSTGADLLDTGSWLLVGPTNKWAMLDASTTTRSEAERQIVVTIAPAGRVDSIGLFNLDAASVRIQSATSGYDESFSLVETSGIIGWHAWFFEPVERRDQLLVTDLPPWLNQSITITIDNGTATAKAGNLVAGQFIDMGLTLSGAEAGIVDYSTKDVDRWGTTTLTEGPFVDKLSLQAAVDYQDVDRVKRFLADYRATATAWQGTDQFGAVTLFGFVRSYSIKFDEAVEGTASLELEGLT